MSQPLVTRNIKWVTMLIAYSIGVGTALVYFSNRTDEWPEKAWEISKADSEKNPLILGEDPEGSFESRVNSAISSAIRLISKKQKWKHRIETLELRIKAIPEENGNWLLSFVEWPYRSLLDKVKVIVDNEGTAWIQSESDHDD